MRGANEELILPLPADVSPLRAATHVRGTLLISSRESLSRRGAFARYESLLDRADRDALRAMIAGEWLPMSVGLAHYEACDRLGLAVDEQVEIGADVSRRVHDTFVGVVVRMAKNIGVTPWTLLTHGNQIFRRTFNGGGGIRVSKLGPSEAKVEMVGVPLLEVPYFRQGLRGLYQASVGLFCKRSFAREIAELATPTSLALRLSWS